MFESDEKVEISHLIDDLNDLVQRHHDQIGSLRDVVNKAQHSRVKAAAEKFINEHSLHIAQLSRLIHRYGGETAGGGDFRQFGAKARVTAGQLVGDAGIIAAVRKNEHKLVLEYERCLRSLRAMPELEPLLEEHFQAGKRRLAAIEPLSETAGAEPG